MYEHSSNGSDNDPSKPTDKLTILNRSMEWNQENKQQIIDQLIKMITWRPLAYASEVGESFRPVIPTWTVNSMYGLSIGYCFADAGVKLYKIKDKPKNDIIKKGGDLFVWHFFASMAFPALTIHTIVTDGPKYLEKNQNKINHCKQKMYDYVKQYHEKRNKPVPSFGNTKIGRNVLTQYAKFILRYGKYIPTAIGLMSIPFIIHPIDKTVDVIMSNTIRRLYWTQDEIEENRYHPH